MQNLFENYLKNGLPEYDSKYLSTYQYVMLLSKNIVSYFIMSIKVGSFVVPSF